MTPKRVKRLAISVFDLAILLIAFAATQLNANPNHLVALEGAIQEIYEQNKDAIVRVKVATETKDETGQAQTSLVVFSGFFISKEGRVLTNAIPEDKTTRIWIEKDGLSYLSDLVGNDERTNISLLQAINLPKNFEHIELPAQQSKSTIGSFAFAITSPLDFAPSPTFGLVTGYESHFANIVFPFTYTRVSIPIGPAEGGSPVFNAKGDLLGISMASMPEVRSSYIIPHQALIRIVRDLTHEGEVQYGVIPLEFEERSDRFNLSRRIRIKTIVPGSPAARAGLRSGDHLKTIDGEAVTSINQVRDILFFKDPENFLLFEVERENKKLEFAILLEPQADHLPAEGITETEEKPSDESQS
ncbi:MAG: S1C family serine protease [Verrucomicrobiota bacterium]